MTESMSEERQQVAYDVSRYGAATVASVADQSKALLLSSRLACCLF